MIGVNVSVAIRVRPSPIIGSQRIIECEDPVIGIKNPFQRAMGDQQFEFNNVFQPSVGQEKIFQDIGTDLVDHILDGQNANCIAFGASNTGKSYTVFGGE